MTNKLYILKKILFKSPATSIAVKSPVIRKTLKVRKSFILLKKEPYDTLVINSLRKGFHSVINFTVPMTNN